MSDRDALGRFLPGNVTASTGGKLRAERLSPERRQAIARAGWRGLVNRRFGGDARAAGEWLGALGAWAADAPYRDRFPVFEHPGPCPAGG